MAFAAVPKARPSSWIRDSAPSGISIYVSDACDINIGASWGGAVQRPLRDYDGYIDELRISDTAFKESWFLTAPAPVPLSATRPTLALGLSGAGLVMRRRTRG